MLGVLKYLGYFLDGTYTTTFLNLRVLTALETELVRHSLSGGGEMIGWEVTVL